MNVVEEVLAWRNRVNYDRSPLSLSGDWKLLEFFEDGRTELYDLKNDLGETTNLLTERPQLAEQLSNELIEWRRNVGAQLPEPNLER